MADVSRTLGNLIDNPVLKKFFKAFKKLDAKTPIPNQALPIAFNSDKEESSLFIVGSAVKALDYIANLAHKQSIARDKKGKSDRDIEFYCTGYVDNNNDYVIDQIHIPSIYYFPGKLKNTVDLQKFFFTKFPKDIHTETTSYLYEYLQNLNTNDLKYARKAFAMYGITKSTSKEGNDRNCPTLGNIANAVVPGQVTFEGPIASGVLILTPKNMTRSSNKQFELSNGSLEAVVIDYRQNPTGYTYPVELHNITNCQIENKAGDLDFYPISRSQQNLNGLPNIKFIDLQLIK